VVLDVERRHIAGKALVQPDVGPVPALDVIAEPVLAEFVRDERGAGVFRFGTPAVQSPVGERGRADVFLAAFVPHLRHAIDMCINNAMN